MTTPSKMRLVHNERIKLLATALNNLGLALIIGGLIAPAVSEQLQGGWSAFIRVAWTLLGVGVIFCAQLVLGRLLESDN